MSRASRILKLAAGVGLIWCSLLSASFSFGQRVSSGLLTTNGPLSAPGLTNGTHWTSANQPAWAMATVARTTPLAETNQFDPGVTPPAVASLQAATVPAPAVPEEIEIQASGAVAQYGPHKAIFAPNASAAIPVELRIPGLAAGQSLKIRLFGLCYFDPGSGKSALLAGLQDSEGELLSPNRVIYREAIEGADLVYTYTASSFEQDIVLRKQLPDPRTLGFDARTVRVAVVSELLAPPEPRRIPNRIDLRAINRELGVQGAGEEALPDEVLWFGSMRVLAGKAFTLGNSGVAVPSGKALYELEGRHFIFEFTPYRLLKAQLDALPEGTLHAKINPPGTLKSLLANQSLPTSKQAASSKMQLAQAPVDATPGVVLDYIIVSSPLLNVDFAGSSSSKVGFAAVGQTPTDYWNGYWPCGPLVSLPRLTNSDHSISAAGMIVSNATGAGGGFSTDPMYDNYVYTSGRDIYVKVTNLPPNTYNIYLYGHDGNPAHNGIYELSRAGTVLGRKGTGVIGQTSLSTNWEAGQQYVVFRDVAVTNQDLTIDVIPNSIGYAYLNGLQIVPSDAVPPGVPPITELININFGADSSAKTGLGAVGQSANDYWNGYGFEYATSAALSHLTNASGIATVAGLTVLNGPGVDGWSAGDGMYDSFVYGWQYGNIELLLTNLPAGSYDFYVYAHGYDAVTADPVQLWTGPHDYGVKQASLWGTICQTANWDEGQQYVVFRDVPVEIGQPVTMVVGHDIYNGTSLHGLQIVRHGSEDVDADGLPDAWEVKYFGDTGADPNADPDGDGLSNRGEYQLGSDPTQADTDGDHAPDSEGLEQVWFDDANPAGVFEMGDQEWWNWTGYWYDGDGWWGSELYPYSGSQMHVSDLVLDDWHQHYFAGAVVNSLVSTGDVLFAYVNLDPSYPPSEIMLQWWTLGEDGSESWEHRAYWGSNLLNWGTDGTASRRSMGALPDSGYWVRLEIPASAVGLEGKVIQGMAFTLFSGRAAWDRAGVLRRVAPIITLQPSSQAVLQGGSATFNVGAVGTTPLSFQWQLDGANLAGKTAASLTLANVQPGQAGSYAVSITNAAGASESAAATLTVIPASWLIQHFGPNYMNNPAAAPGADPDSDGVNNLWEYRLGRNPVVAGTTPDTSGLINLQLYTPLR